MKTPKTEIDYRITALRAMAGTNYWALPKGLAVALSGDLPALMLLVYLIDQYNYHHENTPGFRAHGKFYSTAQAIYDHTGMIERTQRNASRRLEKTGLISVEVVGVPPRRWFRLDIESILLANEDPWNFKKLVNPERDSELTTQSERDSELNRNGIPNQSGTGRRIYITNPNLTNPNGTNPDNGTKVPWGPLDGAQPEEGDQNDLPQGHPLASLPDTRSLRERMWAGEDIFNQTFPVQTFPVSGNRTAPPPEDGEWIDDEETDMEEEGGPQFDEDCPRNPPIAPQPISSLEQPPIKPPAPTSVARPSLLPETALCPRDLLRAFLLRNKDVFSQMVLKDGGEPSKAEVRVSKWLNQIRHRTFLMNKFKPGWLEDKRKIPFLPGDPGGLGAMDWSQALDIVQASVDGLRAAWGGGLDWPKAKPDGSREKVALDAYLMNQAPTGTTAPWLGFLLGNRRPEARERAEASEAELIEDYGDKAYEAALQLLSEREDGRPWDAGKRADWFKGINRALAWRRSQAPVLLGDADVWGGNGNTINSSPGFIALVGDWAREGHGFLRWGFVYPGGPGWQDFAAWAKAERNVNLDPKKVKQSWQKPRLID